MTGRLPYSGIGARATPARVLARMTELAARLDNNYILRSGAAEGADSAFNDGSTSKEIYLPWRNFNGSRSPLFIDNTDFITREAALAAYELVKKYHPNVAALSKPAIRLHMRNAFIIGGRDLKTPSKFCICWTPNGRVTGGTGMALRFAIHFNVPIYNLANPEWVTNSAILESLSMSGL